VISHIKLTLHDDTIGSITVQFDRWDGPHAQYRWTIIPPGMPIYSGSELRMGASSQPNDGQALATLLSFLGAFAEAVDVTRRAGIESDNLDMFPEQLQEWAYQVGSDEFSVLESSVCGGDDA